MQIGRGVVVVMILSLDTSEFFFFLFFYLYGLVLYGLENIDLYEISFIINLFGLGGSKEIFILGWKRVQYLRKLGLKNLNIHVFLIHQTNSYKDAAILFPQFNQSFMEVPAASLFHQHMAIFGIQM